MVDVDISTCVTEWRAQILEADNGKRYVASFPADVTRPVQYGSGVKVNAVYMSQFKLIPYNRIEDHFWDQLQIPISAGTVSNFNRDAYERLEYFDQWVRKQLASSPLVHADETGINISSKGHWLHTVSNDQFSYFYPHARRGGGLQERTPGTFLNVCKTLKMMSFGSWKTNRFRSQTTRLKTISA